MTAIVFSGSGILYPEFLGSADYLLSKGHVQKYNMQFVGTSGGALVAAMLASGITPRAALEIAKKTLPGSLMQWNRKFWQPADQIGLYSLKKVEDVLKEYVAKTFSECIYPLTIATTAHPGVPVYFDCINTPKAPVAKIAVASSSVPFLFTPVKYKGMLLHDGGSTNNFATEVVEEGTKIIGVKFGSSRKKRLDNTPMPESRMDYVGGVMDALMYEVEEDANEVIHLSSPYFAFDLFGIKEEDVDKMFKLGYEQTKKYYGG